MWRFLYGPQDGFANLSQFDGGTGPRLGTKAGVEVRFSSGESTGKDRNRSRWLDAQAAADKLRPDIQCDRSDRRQIGIRHAPGVCASRSGALVEAGGERFWRVPDHPRQGRGGEPPEIYMVETRKTRRVANHRCRARRAQGGRARRHWRDSRNWSGRTYGSTSRV